MASGGLTGFARGGRVTLLGQLGNLAVSLTSVVVLSRLLPPSDFGLIAMVGVVGTLGTILRDMGLSLSALRAPELSNQQASNMFWANTVMGAVAAALMAASGPLLADIYSEPRLIAITPAMALSMFLGGLQAQVQVQLARTKRFGTLAAISVFGNAAGLVVAIAGAVLGLGYWALVAQTLTSSISDAILKFYAAHWRPLRPRRRSGMRPLLVSGADFSATTVVNFFSDNVATFMIGVNMGASDVGLYGRADQLIRMPMKLIVPLVNVAVPTLNEAKRAGEDTGAHLLRLQSTVGIVMAFAMAAGGAASPGLFRFVLGPEWAPSASVFRLLSVGGVALALSQVNYWAFLVADRSRELLKFNAVAKPMTVLLVVAGSMVSLEGTALAASFALVIAWALGVGWVGRVAGLSVRKFYANGLRLVGGCAATVGASAALDALWPSESPLRTLLCLVGAPLVLAGFLSVSRSGRSELAGALRAVAAVVRGR